MYYSSLISKLVGALCVLALVLFQLLELANQRSYSSRSNLLDKVWCTQINRRDEERKRSLIHVITSQGLPRHLLAINVGMFSAHSGILLKKPWPYVKNEKNE